MDEKGRQNAELRERAERQAEKLKRLSVRVAALEQAGATAREGAAKLARKSRLDDQLIADMRKQLFPDPATVGLARDEAAELRAKNETLERKLASALLIVQQSGSSQLQALCAGAQLELNDARERAQLLSRDRAALLRRVFELEERRLAAAGELDVV